MLRLHTLVGSVVAGVACMVMCAPVALADAGTFLEELQINSAWLPGRSADEVIAAGYAVCSDLRSGVTVLDEMSRVEQLYQFQQGTLFVSAATTHLCPDFAG